MAMPKPQVMPERAGEMLDELIGLAVKYDDDATGLTIQEIIAAFAIAQGKLMWLAALAGWPLQDVRNLVDMNQDCAIRGMLDRDDLEDATLGALASERKQ